eukprot:CAMPEP_0184006892 /NCGR_PEP_ID=MMETSP0954-20121128/985_1 /TAXON_ID=627963 /ORGANISM="Aplanochytrium sp, Strain PBS07" /LENGTH=163 /DNA_ID=CAMNT_0026285571 /DNA_START=353 /DNA_END=844 /DNA_ORIENTATION=+
MAVPYSVFVYGSLMCPDVLKILLGRIPKHSKAFVNGFERFCVKGYSFPACIPASNSVKSVDGLLLEGISKEELQMFDEFEDEYTREIVKVSLFPSPEAKPITGTDDTAVQEADKADAYMYIWNEAQDILEGSWSFDRHYLPKKKEYLVMCDKFVKEYREEASS